MEYVLYCKLSDINSTRFKLLMGSANYSAICFDDIRLEEAINAVVFCQNGIETKSITAGEVTARFHTASDYKTQVCLALYRKDDGDADEMVLCEMALCNTENTDISLKIGVPDDGELYSLKAFSWDIKNGISPMFCAESILVRQ